jgi:hypothetical protein
MVQAADRCCYSVSYNCKKTEVSKGIEFILSNVLYYISKCEKTMSISYPQEIDPRRLVGVRAERVTNVSSTDFPGHYPDEDHAWNLEKFRKVRLRSLEKMSLL